MVVGVGEPGQVQQLEDPAVQGLRVLADGRGQCVDGLGRLLAQLGPGQGVCLPVAGEDVLDAEQGHLWGVRLSPLDRSPHTLHPPPRLTGRCHPIDGSGITRLAQPRAADTVSAGCSSTTSAGLRPADAGESREAVRFTGQFAGGSPVSSASAIAEVAFRGRPRGFSAGQSVDPATGRKSNTALLLGLLRGDEGELRAAFEVAGRMLAGDTRPDGQVISVGNAAHDPMMKLAHDIIQLSMRGEPERAWAQVRQHPPGRQAAVLSILAAFLNY
ncbi:hypothetical protein [Streptomyces europaeiscabiei]|uniref:hypothetical protein n=1 Tax=Streptomyces europaeiscabiei TaxID=146819 RepID=UPI0038F60BFF